MTFGLWPRNHCAQLHWNSADQWTRNTSAQKSQQVVIAKTDMQEEIDRKSSPSCLCCADTSHPVSRVGCQLAPDRIADGVLQ